MKKLYGVLIISIGCVLTAMAQDEGVITKKARIDKANNIFLGLGPSINFGKNIGDYGTGFNVELGFMKRLNRLLSIGPSISYLNFKYDPEKTIPGDDAEAGFYRGSGDIDTDWYGSAYSSWNDKYVLTESYDYGYLLALEGGDVSLLSLAVNLKLNFVPVRDNSIVSFYVFAKPFVSSVQRKEVSGTGTMYVYEAYELFGETEQDDWLYYNLGDDTWYANGYVDRWGASGYPELEKKSSVSGGIFIGPGVEFLPAKRLSFYLQPMIGYTFPISFVSTKSYDTSIKSYTDPAFPIVKKGFTSLTVQVGASFNF